MNLFPEQAKLVNDITPVLQQAGSVILSCETGTGKTAISLACAANLGIPVMIVCPKAVIFSWYLLAKKYQIDILDCVNYDTIALGKCYPKSELEKHTLSRRIVSSYYHPAHGWDLPTPCLLIFDEVHRCKKKTTRYGKLFCQAVESANAGISLLLVSATPYETAAEGSIYLYATKQIRSISSAPSFLRQSSAKDKLTTLQSFLAPHSYHLRLSEIEALSGCTSYLSTMLVPIADANDIINRYQKIPRNSDDTLKEITKLRAKIEISKVPSLIERITAANASHSVVVFAFFLKTLHQLSDAFPDALLLTGKTSTRDRRQLLKEFQGPSQKLLLLQSTVCSEGIDLHDQYGNYPRKTFITTVLSVTHLQQMLGRCNRIGQVSDVHQHLIFAAGIELEEKCARRINRKRRRLDQLTDRDIPLLK